jgi:hypothetical protein
MKTVNWLFLVLLILLLVSSVTLPRSAFAGGGTSSGGGYHLTALTWRVTGESRATGYHLRSPESPSLESGCCCIYLPCVTK